MIDTLMRGGLMMIPILVGSLLALTIVFERAWALRAQRVVPGDFLQRMEKMVAEGRHTEALSACRENDSHAARIMAAGLEQAGQSRPIITEALEMAGRQETARLGRWVGALGAIAALEPLMGLLGTVLGLISSFQDVERLQVVGNPSVVASGVWQALITTAAGLVIAIPTFAMYRYFRARVAGQVVRMEGCAFQLVQGLSLPQAARPEGGSPS